MSALHPEQFWEAAARWPDIELDGRAFDDYLRLRSVEAAGPALRVPLQIESLFLCCACALGDDAACRAFQRTYGRAVRRAIARIEPDAQFVEEISARVFDKLLVGPEPRITRYGGRGDLTAWLKVVASRAAIDGRPPHADEADPPPSSDEPVASMSPESMILARAHALDFNEALRVAAARLDSKEREILRLHYAHGSNIDEIGALYGVHRATVARWLKRASTKIGRAVREELRAKHGLDAADVTSLLRSAGSLLEQALPATLWADTLKDVPGTTLG